MEEEQLLLANVWVQCGLRILAVWIVPFIVILSHMKPGILVMILSTLAATGEVVLSVWFRRSGKGKVGRNPLPHKSFFPLLASLYTVQACCQAFFAGAEVPSTPHPIVSKHSRGGGGGGFQLDAEPWDLAWSPKTISVILPCAEERDYAFKTVKSVFTNTPPDVLHEIVVVDDGSEPPLAETHLQPDIQKQYKVKLLRHAETVGLIGAKKTGGDAATGDILAFFDCHVAPQPGWHRGFLSAVGSNYRRMVVPAITALDVDTWEQTGYGGGVAKCYLTWDADFKWFDSDDKYIAVISGGLLGMARRWWRETGGYDSDMWGWGGENLDQSLRVWLCGGEIVMVSDSQVAHMWRTEDPRTNARYRRVGDTSRNRARAAYGWFGDFAAKLKHYGTFGNSDPTADGLPWYGNLSSFERVKHGCGGGRPFAWFLRRFRELYEDAGMIPDEIFMLREEKSGKCLRYQGEAGTSPDGSGRAELQDCQKEDHRFFWHFGNRNSQKGGACCSGIRAWNTDQCISSTQEAQISTAVCDVAGQREDQEWSLNSEGLLTKGGDMCLGTQERDQLAEAPCVSFRRYGRPRWSMQEQAMPLETRLYRNAQRERPHIFGSLGVQDAALRKPELPIECRSASSSTPCVTLNVMGESGKCFDEHGFLTSAKDYCAPYILSMQTSSGSTWQLKLAETQKCLEHMDGDDLDMWSLQSCHSGETQRFQVFDHQTKACASIEGRPPLCFEIERVKF